MPRKVVFCLLGGLIVASLLFSLFACAVQETDILSSKQRFRVATTTSLYDTGLWWYLEPLFEKKYGVEMDVLYAGTGVALEYGKRGDVDVVIVHDKARELQFISEGYGTERIIFAYNYFVVLGPTNDPAGIKGMKPEEAFKKLAVSGSAAFVSRGDESGTHAREKAIWKSAGFDYAKIRKSGQWYIEAGRGMGPTLLMAKEKMAYTLSDMGTFLAYKGKLELVPIVDKGSILLNAYSVLPVNREKVKNVNAAMSKNLVQFLTSAEIQKLIGEYGVKSYGMPLFAPCAGAPEPTSQ